VVLTPRSPRTVGGLLAAVALVLAAPASVRPASSPQAAAIRGRVEVGRPLSSSRPASHDPADAEHGLTPEVYRQAVVYLDPPPERLQRPVEVRARMDQRGQRFIPHLLAIAAGTFVDFPNDDHIFHNVFSLSKAKRFDLGRYAAGRSKAVRFDQPGIVRVFCEIHSHMNAFILVFDHRYFAVTDEEGRFRLDRVPPGTYRVTAWYEGVAQQTRTVLVPPSGDVDVTFTLK
jgi:plastocyanin